MKKIIISTVVWMLASSATYASEAGGTISTGISTSGLEFSLPCNPASVSNGTVNAQTCAISCNAGYTLSGNSCVAPAPTGGGGGWGGGGWGGGGGSVTPPVITASGTTSATGVTITGSTNTGATVTVGTGTNLTITKSGSTVTVTTTTPLGTTTTTFVQPSLVIPSLSGIQATDITTNWAKGYIQKLIARGVVNNAQEFKPDNHLTRAEFLKIAINAAGWKIGTDGKTSFADVPSDMWYAPYVSLGLSKNLISGAQTNFRPNDTISRAEAAKIIVGMFGLKKASPEGIFADMSIESSLTPYAEMAKALGIFSGQTVEGKLHFRPNDPITRAEIAKVIVNAFRL